MRYSKVKAKRTSRRELIVVTFTLMVIFIGSTLFATALFNVFLKDSSAFSNNFKDDETAMTSGNVENNTAKEGSVTTFYIIQCGVFGIKENADKVNNDLNSQGMSFISEEGGKYKVIYSICNSGNEDEIMAMIESKGVAVAKIKKEITYSNICDEEIGEMIKGLISVVDKLKDNSVSSVEIQSLKKWCKELEQCDANEENANKANELRKYIEELPDEIDKTKISEINKKIYQCIV
ncbi:Hypothetical protein CM240_1516 [Clostridium bornimense]|uniref:Uncharacterized protein n=1 Tax=Clostridium bornimense TaxID=1216932 RepID=W6SG44_9CLOT|nr:SPOR domain-containing protein [Clostridium bornimense]CDM68675.1 Hypothetical protein CM240_1516 [Clostridium bornimense]